MNNFFWFFSSIFSSYFINPREGICIMTSSGGAESCWLKHLNISKRSDQDVVNCKKNMTGRRIWQCAFIIQTVRAFSKHRRRNFYTKFPSENDRIDRIFDAKKETRSYREVFLKQIIKNWTNQLLPLGKFSRGP